MSRFLRSFWLTLTVCFLFVFAAVGFELIRDEAENAGFCEGEVFAASLSEFVFSAEIFGEKLFCDFSALKTWLFPAEKAALALFLPLRPIIWAINSVLMQVA